MYEFIFTKQSLKDRKKLQASVYVAKARIILEEIRANPFNPEHDHEKLHGEGENVYSKRINKQHRIVYQVFTEEHKIKLLRMWTHYE